MLIKIYRLVDPTTNETRYIGQTNRTLSARLSGHATLPSKSIKAWIEQLRDCSERPKIELIEEVEESEANDRERYWIDYHRQSGLILNSINHHPFSGGRGESRKVNTPTKVDYGQRDYLSITEMAKREGVSVQLIRKLCDQGRVEGAQKIGKTWAIPSYWNRPTTKAGRPSKRNN